MNGKHGAGQPVERRITLGVLIVGTAIAVALAFGPDWSVKVGLGVAIAMALLATFMSRREIDRISAAHRIELKAVLAASMEQANRHHRDSLALMDRFDARADQLNATVQRLTSELGLANSELATMRGNSAWLRGEVAERQARINALEVQLAAAEAEREAAANDDNLLNLPRYGVASSRDLLPTAEELWADGDHPTVVDLAMLALPGVLDERKQA